MRPFWFKNMTDQAILPRLRFQAKSLYYHLVLPIEAELFRDLFLSPGISTKATTRTPIDTPQ